MIGDVAPVRLSPPPASRRILHIIASADPRGGGPIEGAVRAGEQWRRAGVEQELLTLDNPAAPFLKDVPATVHALGPRRGRMPWSRYGYVPGVVDWIRRHRSNYDAVIVAGLWNYSAMAARFGLIGGTVPYFVFTHGMLDPWFRATYPLKHAAKQLFWLINEGPLLRHAKGVLFTTQDEQMLAEKQFWPYRVRARVVGYGTADVEDRPGEQVAAFRGARPELAGRRFLLFLSRIHPKKGCDLLIEGFSAIAAAEPDLDLVIAGPDDSGMVVGLRAQAKSLGIAERVHFPGMLTGDVKWGAFRACEAFALVSHQENFGVVVAEAMACSKPVLLTNKINIWREVDEDGAGLVETDTADGARALLHRFANLSSTERAKMGENARASFRRRFMIETAATNLLAVINEGIAR